jgi:rhomboid protease GluP
MIGFVASSLAGAFIPPIPILPPLIVLEAGRFTAGASASICGLIGAILAYGHRTGSGAARSYAMSNVIMLAFMGFLIPVIDNYAHFGGLGGGYLIARLLDPLKTERIDHLAIAAGLLALSILSMIASVVLYLVF